MQNMEIAWVFYEIADLLELKRDNPYKIRAYRRAAQAIENYPHPLEELTDSRAFEEIPGIGSHIAEKIRELLATGQVEYHQALKKEIPPGLLEIMKIPGIGAKIAIKLYHSLQITTLDELEAAAKDHRVKMIPGLGSKVEHNILRGIQALRTKRGRAPIGIAMSAAEEFLRVFRGLSEVDRASVAGSLRRRKETVGDIDLVVSARDPEAVMDIFTGHPQVREVLSRGETKASVVNWLGLQIDLRVVRPEEFWSTLHHFTGSREHNIRLRELAHRKGYKINEYGLFHEGEKDELIPLASEEDLYRHLDLPYIPPELREDSGEIEAAQRGELPRLVELADIKGDLHLHTNWSDGVAGLEEVVAKARILGYEYLAITDHSKSLAVARGLDEERLAQQHEAIRRINEELAQQRQEDPSLGEFHLLTGVEMDILANGALDYPDHILEGMDVVIASIHSGFRQPREKLTARVVEAMKNKHVDIVAHPTGRLLGRRDPYEIDMQEIMEAAAKYGTILEINSSPDRLDLNDQYCRLAKEYGIKIAINTDAHDLQRMEDIQWGVGVARRGWLEPEDVVNTLGYREILRVLRRER